MSILHEALPFQLLQTEKEVTKLRGDLEQMQPLLEEAVQEAVSTMKTIEVDSKVAEETQATVQKEEEEAKKKAKEAKAIADDAQRELDEALPALVSPSVKLVTTCPLGLKHGFI